MYTLAIANQKGGVAKTTSAANLADAAAEQGARVLLVDLDPQGNASVLTDAQPRTWEGNAFGKAQLLTISDALHFAQERAGAPVQTGTVLSVAVPAGAHWSPRLQVAPANQDLAARGEEAFPGAERRLRLGLSGAEDSVDLVVLDCGPALGPLFLAALHAADGVLLVSEPADNALEGLPRTVTVLRSVRAQRGGEAPALLGVVATNMPTREARAGELLELMRTDYGTQLWDVVPRRAVVRQAEGAHAPLRAMGRSAGEVAQVYARLAARVLAQAWIPPAAVSGVDVASTGGVR